MEENVRKRFVAYMEEIKEMDDESKEWKKLDEYDKLLYRTVDVVQFFKLEVMRQYQNKPLAQNFQNVWDHLLGTIEMQDYDPRKYSTSLD